jgi:hypothetical protein
MSGISFLKINLFHWTPFTRLLANFDEVRAFVNERPHSRWCLKYPISCGANGHRILTPDCQEPPNWPRPFIVQEFIQMDRPEVYRTYGAAGELFGWVVRRYPDGAKISPWVAHAQGARYACLGEPPEQAVAAARSALVAVKLFDSFGCVDLMCRPDGAWVVLEVGTDGLFNHVDRDWGDVEMENELSRRVADSFWQAARNRLSSIVHA